MKIDSQTLSLFADGMATCLSAGLPPQRALELNRFEKQSKALGKLVDLARERCGQGMPLSEALEPGRKVPAALFSASDSGGRGGRPAGRGLSIVVPPITPHRPVRAAGAQHLALSADFGLLRVGRPHWILSVFWQDRRRLAFLFGQFWSRLAAGVWQAGSC